MKRLVSIILAIILLVSTFAFSASAMPVMPNTGTEGNISWVFDPSTGTLTFSGEGPMIDDAGPRIWEYHWKNILHIVFEDGITRVGSWSFNMCTNAVSADLGSVEVIGESAFQNCISLEKVVIPKTVKKIEDEAFWENTSLKEIKTSAKTSIGKYAFGACSSLKTVNMKNATSVSKYAFIDSDKLTTVYMPKATINSYAFEDCDKIKNITAKELKKCALFNLDTLKTVTVNGKAGALAVYGSSSLTTAVVKGGVANSAFSNCTSLKTVNLKKSDKIGENAFRGCRSLVKVTNAKSVKTIGSCAFYDCVNLKTLETGSALSKVGKNAFYNCPKYVA